MAVVQVALSVERTAPSATYQSMVLKVRETILVQIDGKTELSGFMCPTLSALLRRQHRVPDGGRTSTL